MNAARHPTTFSNLPLVQPNLFIDLLSHRSGEPTDTNWGQLFFRLRNEVKRRHCFG
jgi:hypothetical protein